MIIIRLFDAETSRFYYLLWDDQTMRPFNKGLELPEFEAYFLNFLNSGEDGKELLNYLLKRVNINNISCRTPNDNLEVFLKNNKAGYNGTHADYDSLLNLYCR